LGLIGFVAALAGGIGLANRGTKAKKEHQIETKIATNDVQPTTSVREISCRYCGKKRPIAGEFCPMCGRSSHAISTSMKKCTVCKATMSDDSNYCAHCGQKFEEKSNLSEESKQYYYTSEGKKKERSSLQKESKTEIPSDHLPENDLIIYENLNLGIKRLQYPSSWSVEEIENNQVHFYPQESEITEATDKAPLEVWIALYYANKNILDSEHIEKRIDKIHRGYEAFQLLHSDNHGTLSGIPAYKIVYKGRSKDKGSTIKKMEMGTIVNYIEYIINAGSDENTYSDNLPTFENMISSLQLTKTLAQF
jgi:RNA polymerase subunit RPABC4/transcription elongation factor Spt4